MLNAGLLLSGKAEHSYENFPQPEWCKGRRSYCRVHHDNGCAREMEMKPRCPQMRLRALRHDVEMREWFPGKELGEVHAASASICCKTNAKHSFHFLFIKLKILVRFFLGG